MMMMHYHGKMTATHALRLRVSVLLTAFYSVKLVIHVKILNFSLAISKQL